MGSTNPEIESWDDSDEEPVHTVSLSAFTMSQTLITQAQYQAVMGVNPSSYDTGSTLPVEGVNWYDAVLFCNQLSKLAGLDTVYSYNSVYSTSTYPLGLFDTFYSVSIDYSKIGYRLPTEAEYEYAERAGNDTTDYYWGRYFPPTTAADTDAIDSNVVWYYNDNSPYHIPQVATKKPNAWGLLLPGTSNPATCGHFKTSHSS